MTAEDPADAELFQSLYRELHRIAGRLFRSQRGHHTLQPTALVNEAYLKMVKPADSGGKPGGGWNDANHFLSTAARAMRQVLVNHARDRQAAKRGGADRGQRVTLSDVHDRGLPKELEVLAVNDLIERLGELDERQGKIAELRFFGGLTNKEIATVLEVSLRTVELDWRMAKDWLAKQLAAGDTTD